MYVNHCDECGSLELAKCSCYDDDDCICTDCECAYDAFFVGDLWGCRNCVSMYLRQWSAPENGGRQ